VEQEPNDTYSNANYWDVTSEMQGALDAKRDKDMYRFTAPQSGIYKITLSNVPSNIEPNLFIYRGTNSNAVASSTTAGAGGSAQVEIDANQGETFYVKVIARSASTTSNQPYTLSTEAIPDPDEPNDEWSEATPWDAFSSSIQGYFFELVTGPADLYKFTVPQSAGSVLLTVNLTDVPANVEPNMFIKNSAGSTVASNADAQAGQPISIMIDANPGETYYVSVNPQNRFQTSESLYTLSITTTPDPTEPNDTFDLATVWNYTAGPIQGYFAEAVSGPADYYRFTAPPGTSPVAMTVQLEDVPANVAPRMFIYNSQFNPVKSKTNAGKGDSISLTFDAQPGATYYVKVLPSSRLMISSQPYTLSMSGY